MKTPSPNGQDTEELLNQARAGRADAFEQLFSRHQTYLARFVSLRLDPKVGPRVSPSDVVQEAHLEALRRLQEYLASPLLPFRLWLRQITQDRILKMHRYHVTAARRSIEREVPLPNGSSILLANHLVKSDDQPIRRLEKREISRQVRQALSQLSEEDAEIMLMRAVEGLSYSEIGYLLGVEVSTARKRYSRALVRMHMIMFEGRSER